MRLRQRQAEDELSALAIRPIFHPELAAVGIGELARDGETEPGAVLLGGEERGEDGVAILGNGGPVVIEALDDAELVMVESI
mgnify:CR=1 FL=1